MTRKCADCKYLVRTHPEQRFLLCTFWAANPCKLIGAAQMYGKSYVELHCHMQPSAHACGFYEQGREKRA